MLLSPSRQMTTGPGLPQPSSSSPVGMQQPMLFLFFDFFHPAAAATATSEIYYPTRSPHHGSRPLGDPHLNSATAAFDPFLLPLRPGVWISCPIHRTGSSSTSTAQTTLVLGDTFGTSDPTPLARLVLPYALSSPLLSRSMETDSSSRHGYRAQRTKSAGTAIEPPTPASHRDLTALNPRAHQAT